MPAAFGVSLTVPLAASLPVQALDAVQEVALVDDHVRVELRPKVMLAGDAPMVTVGSGAATVNDAVALPLPPVPVQVRHSRVNRSR